MAVTRSRTVPSSQLVFGQVDLFQVDGYTRITGVVPGGMTCAVYFNNQLQSWPLTAGSAVTDVQAVSGKVYWQELGGSTGIYGIRFRPNVVGYWRILLTYASVNQIVALDFDVTDAPESAGSGLVAGFIKPVTFP